MIEMKVAVLGATGKAGSLILAEGQKRGLEMTAIARNKEKVTLEVPVIEKNVYDLEPTDIQDFDVLVSALGFWEDVSQFSSSTNHLITILKGLNTRLIVVGGAGSLYMDAEKTTQLKDTPDFPESILPLVNAMSDSLELLRQSEGVQWSYLSPAADFDADGSTTGKYVLASEFYETNAEGQSYISYGDYALAVVDEIETNAHPNQRFSVHN